MPPSFPDNNLIVLLVPLEDGAGPDPEFLTNFGGHGNLALGGKFGMCERHNCYITMVMRQSQRDTRLIQRTIEALLYEEFAAESLPVIDAEFERSGNSLSTVEERVFPARTRSS